VSKVDDRNKATSAKQIKGLKTATRDTLYLSADGKTLTTWTGEHAAKITYLNKRSSPVGRSFYNLRAIDIYGNPWSGTSPGHSMYANVKRTKVAR
jgi:hypothetical protein